MTILEQIQNAIEEGNPGETEKLVRQAVNQHISAARIVEEAMTPAMRTVGENYRSKGCLLYTSSMGVTSDKCCTFKDKTGICHGFAAIDPAIFGNADDIKAHFSEYLETLRQSPKAEGAEQIYTHGEKRCV